MAVFDQPYYYEQIKKTIVGFGALFSGVKVIRRKQDGTVGEVVKVPIAYGPKEKFIARIDADPELNNGVLITLPRMSFEISGYSYNPAEMTNKMNKIQCKTSSGLTYSYSPVPYDISLNLSVMTKGTEDGLAILEQILPLFAPNYTMTINAIPALNLVLDIPIILNNVQVQDDYEGDFNQKRLVIHQFDFTIKSKIIGAINSGGLILRTETTLPEFTSEHISEGDLDSGEIITDHWVNTN